MGALVMRALPWALGFLGVESLWHRLTGAGGSGADDAKREVAQAVTRAFGVGALVGAAAVIIVRRIAARRVR